jgi:hypothetical protein
MSVTGHLALNWSASDLVRLPELCRDSMIRDAFSLTCSCTGSKPVIKVEVISIYIKNNFGDLGRRVLDCFLLALEGVLSDKPIFRMDFSDGHRYCPKNKNEVVRCKRHIISKSVWANRRMEDDKRLRRMVGSGNWVPCTRSGCPSSGCTNSTLIVGHWILYVRKHPTTSSV